MAVLLPSTSVDYPRTQSIRQPNQLTAPRTQETSSADEVVLSAALNDIDRSLNDLGPDGQPNYVGTLSPDDLRSKISDLISDEVKNGKLSQDQATNLKSVFDDAFAGGSTDLSFSEGNDEELFDQIEFTTAASFIKDAPSLLQEFLKIAGDQGPQSNYDLAGSGSTISSGGALLLNYTA